VKLETADAPELVVVVANADAEMLLTEPKACCIFAAFCSTTNGTTSRVSLPNATLVYSHNRPQHALTMPCPNHSPSLRDHTKDLGSAPSSIG
jgi:hypothetical protein